MAAANSGSVGRGKAFGALIQEQSGKARNNKPAPKAAGGAQRLATAPAEHRR